MKSKKFKLPDIDYSFNEASNILPKKEAKMQQSKKNKKQSKVKQIEVNDNITPITISQLTKKVKKYDNINIKFINIKELNLSGIQFIITLLNSSKNINIDIDIDKNIKALLANTGFNKIITT